MKSTEEIYENSMLEDAPNEESERNAQQPRWGPKNKGAQILANFYSRGTSGIKIKNAKQRNRYSQSSKRKHNVTSLTRSLSLLSTALINYM